MERIRITLDDGRNAVLRTLVPSDADELRDLFDRLSPESRASRFLSPLSRVPEDMLAALAHPDGVDHIACVLTVRDDRRLGAERELGVARCVRDPQRPDLAEFACTVADSEQGKHLGRLLMTELSRRAQRRGIRRFLGVMRADNVAMQRVMDHLGEVESRRLEGMGVLEVTYRLHREPALRRSA